MAEPFIGEIRVFSFAYPPPGWLPCNGQLLLIKQYQRLYRVFGTTYGGDGETSFALPNLQGRVALSSGTGPDGSGSYAVGQTGGSATVMLTPAQVPVHEHGANASSAGASTGTPSSGVLPAASTNPSVPFYTANGSQLGEMAGNALANNAGGQPHPNVQPSLVFNLCIAATGIFPSRG